MTAGDARRLYSELYALRARAETTRRAKGQPFSQREMRTVLSKPPYSISFRGQAISDWLPDDPARAQVPRDAEVVWAVVRLWSDWAGETDANERYWRTLVERAQPVRARPRQDDSQPCDLPPEQRLRWSNLPPRTACFTGRDDLLQQLGSLLASGPVCVAALRGMGGVGKTQLALEYAHHHHAAGTYDIAWWIRAEQHAAMKDDLLTLAPHLGLSAEADIRTVLSELSQRSNWLLIYDNVTDPASIEGHLPTSGHIILTSRSRGWSRYARPLDVGLFHPTESVAFLSARTGSNEPEALELAEELGHLPLALAQAAAYCEEHQLSIRRYLQLFRSPRVRERLLETGLHSAEYPDSVATTWLLHVEYLRKHRPSALQLLRLCAFLHPDSIHLDLLLSSYHLLPDPLASAVNWLDTQLARAVEEVRGIPFESKEDVIGALVKTGLVTRLDDASVRIHRLVQAATKQEMGNERAAAWRTYADLLLHALHPYPPFPVEPEWDATLGELRIHGDHLARLLLDGVSKEEPVQIKRLVALTDFTREGTHKVITDFEYTYECRLRLTEAFHRASKPFLTALALSNLGYVRCLTGRHTQALEAMEAASAALDEVLPSEDLAGLHEAIQACRSHTARREAADESDDTVVVIIHENAALDRVAEFAGVDGRAVPAFIVMPGQNQITTDLATALGHETDGQLPFPFTPLWR